MIFIKISKFFQKISISLNLWWLLRKLIAADLDWKFFQSCWCLTLFHTSGGHYGPDDHKQPCCLYRVRAGTTKILDFVPVYVWIVPEKLFLEFVSEIFEKLKKNFLTVFTSKGPPFGKKSKISKKNFFWKKSYFFFLNLYCTCSKLSFDVYNSHVSKNFEFWHIFAWKFSFFTMVFWQPDLPKLQLIECCFWCLWTAKDKKSLMEAILGL